MNLNWWLEQYHKIQKDIMVCYRPTLKSYWGDRTLYKSKNFINNKSYNHRSMLDNEIVIEFDDQSYDLNKKHADIVANRLATDNISYSKWDSGNKSVHVHTLLSIGQVSNPSLFKKVFMRHYSEGLPLPDLRLASNNHLIRAEYGIHEKTQKKKRLIYRTPDYPFISIVPQIIWTKYTNEYHRVLKIRTTKEINQLSEHPAIKYILTSEKFRNHSDGRERSLFMLIHILKPSYIGRKDELIKFLQDWYKYSSGIQLSDKQIEGKVKYHWTKTYNFGRTYLSELLESIGLNIEDFEK